MYEEALLHKSSSKEDTRGHHTNNERLEFLGDAILDAIIADICFKKFKDSNEGFLTNTRSKIVKRESLDRVSRELGLSKLVITSSRINYQKTHILGNALEAFIGAVYLDRGYRKTYQFIEKKIIEPHINIDTLAEKEVNFKSKLLEWSQKYKVDLRFDLVENFINNERNQVFQSQAILNDLPAGIGTGFSKKESQQQASNMALRKIKTDRSFVSKVLDKKKEENLFTPLALIAVLFFLGCTEPINIRTDNSPPVIVIYGELTDEFKNQTVKVSRSSPYFDDEPNRGISDAAVTIQSSNNETYLLSEDDSIKGLYYSMHKFSAQTGVDYLLSVEVDFNHDGVPEKYEATTTVIPSIVPDSLTLEPLDAFGNKNYFLYLHSWAVPEESYYLFHVVYNDSLLTERLSRYVVSDDVLFRGQYMKGNLYRFSDLSNKENDTEERRERTIYLQPGDEIDVKSSIISKGYFDFINQCREEKSGENPMFGGPPSNIITNISNGGVGYFVGYSASHTKIVFTPK